VTDPTATEQATALLDEDPREQLQDAISATLAQLSEATDSPKGVRTGAPFAANDVTFDSDTWINRLAEVQGWLRFGNDAFTSDREGFIENLAAALGFENPSDGLEVLGGATQLTEVALERLNDRAERALKLQQDFLSSLETGDENAASATTAWMEAWEESEEDEADFISDDPVAARANVWEIYKLTDKKLNLTPSYQRGDVWRTGDRQSLIESILRGIPLPSLILRKTGASATYEVVDGKQRLTSILRFIGKHPVALAKVDELEELYLQKAAADPTFKAVDGPRELFETDYPKFRKLWSRIMGYPLKMNDENEFYFPFRLRADAKGGLVGKEFERLRGKYFTQVLEETVHVAGEEVTVGALFRDSVSYTVPVIEYTKVSPRQVHEVFKLYNKQGMHLNAEELRNAVYNDVELTRAVLLAAGDAGSAKDSTEVSPTVAAVLASADLGKTLAEYGFGVARYRRTKVLGWIIATLINETQGKITGSTAKHTDLLLERVQTNPSHPLRDSDHIADLFALILEAAELHATHDELWPEKFRGDGKTPKWQDLQLVGSFLGVAIALVGSPDDIEDRIEASADKIYAAALQEWKRPASVQNKDQWSYIARLAEGTVRELGVDIRAASGSIRDRFGSSGVESLLGSIID